jgi:hypothetical protein
MGKHIDVNDDHELYIWARTFGIDAHELVRLVAEVGPSTDRIRDELKRMELARTRGRIFADWKRQGE